MKDPQQVLDLINEVVQNYENSTGINAEIDNSFAHRTLGRIIGIIEHSKLSEDDEDVKE